VIATTHTLMFGTLGSADGTLWLPPIDLDHPSDTEATT
jgi:hypothetical protein